jgi:hypothetical protein
MTTAGDNITKATITAFAEAVFKHYNTAIVWHSGNQPFQTDITGGDATGYATQTYANDISDTNVIASTLVTNFRNYATLISRIRNVRLLKYYQSQADPKATTTFDQTQMTNLNSNYAYDMNANQSGSLKPESNGTVSAYNIDAFVSSLGTVINTNRLSTVTIEEFYCHSNCHGSCHGSI